MLEKNILFNYIITIHNKEDLIRVVMLGVINCAGKNSCIYPVLDGCNDSSELIIDEMIESYPHLNIIKLYADDVHELKTINVGLNQSVQVGEGYNIILQDDVILQDAELESKCIHLYRLYSQLGILSFRHGANISRELLYDESEFIPYADYIQNQCGHNVESNPILKTGYFTFREIALKSPICIPFEVVRKASIPNELYAPWDDLAYCYRVSEAGYANGILAINFLSEINWGTTRIKEQKDDIGKVLYINLAVFRYFHPQISKLDENKYDNIVYRIFD